MDYEKIGFKAGLEIHQQLDTKKLFCSCPSVLRSDAPELEVKRKLHLVAGESGEIDAAAKYQHSLDKEFVYQAYNTTCLVELDEEPPHEINSEALEIALQIALLLNCKIIPITQIMRKTVVDGSNTGGFQRTAMIAQDGYIETSQGKVGISGLFLEEDSARKINEEKGKIIYRLDRLGIPLVEISTEPDIKNAEHAKETALKIGKILRSCKVKRGLGTIRQDINISIKGSNRVELKGFQDPKIMTQAVENETQRQLEFILKKEKNPSEVRNVLDDGKSEFLRPMPGASRMYPETDLPLLKISRDLINEVKKNLPQSTEEIEEELKKRGLNHEMIKLLFKQNKIEKFKELLTILDNPQMVAKTLLIFPKEISSHKKLGIEKIEKILENSLPSLLDMVNQEKIPFSQVKHIMEKLVEGKSFEESVKIEETDNSEIEEKILKIIKEKPGLSAHAYMGLVMKEMRGKISGKDAMEIIGKLVK
jgi:Glu-tRNA(Gln) amidotransferase subunit E-like FAD-binding protein